VAITNTNPHINYTTHQSNSGLIKYQFTKGNDTGPVTVTFRPNGQFIKASVPYTHLNYGAYYVETLSGLLLYLRKWVKL
jgi:hypothetical protein